MPTCQRTAVIDAGFETVWAFYDSLDELELLTPDWVGLRLTHVTGPDGESAPDSYEVGTEIHIRTRLLDLLTGEPWVVEIVDREVTDDEAVFVDDQVGDRGPFAEWRHLHRFVDLGEKTMIHDHVTYRVPGAGSLPVSTPLLAAMLWYRHRKTRSLLE